MAKTALSGKATEIQNAVQLAISSGDSEVLIPEGTFDFLNQGDPWTQVSFPPGMTIRSISPPVLDASGRPTSCKTLLKLPYDVPSGSINDYNHPLWFSVTGNSNGSLPVTRLSGIELRGYRYYNHASVYILNALLLWRVLNFRVDHCIFQDVVGGSTGDGGNSDPGGEVPDHACSGVFDHNVFRNTLGYTDPGGYDNLTVCYGIQPFMYNSNYWDPNISNIMGKYTQYSVYMEDNYFEKWRHCISAGSGIHAVFRHNVINASYGDGEVDVHGQGLSYLGGRCLEVYSNQIINAAIGTCPASGWTPACSGAYGWDGTWHDNMGWTGGSNNVAINHRGGAGAIWNNTVDTTYPTLASVLNEEPSHLGGYVEDLYIWNNHGTTALAVDTGPVLNRDYFLRAPTDAEVANYAANIAAYGDPYTYPHPLVGGVAPVNPILTVNSVPTGIPFTVRKVA